MIREIMWQNLKNKKQKDEILKLSFFIIMDFVK